MTQATKRPWRIRTHPNLGCFIEAPKAENMPYALDVCGEDYTGYGDEAGREANMRLIVKAVNCHDELVEALKALTNEIEEHHLNTFSRGELLYKAKQALQKAEAV